MEIIEPTDPQEESIPIALIPWNRDDDRARYLGYRSSGFKLREALGLIGKAKSTLSHWRKDPVFKDLEDRLPELRKILAMEYAGLEFMRNYRLVLEMDYRILQKSLAKKKTRKDNDGKTVEIPMDSQDFQYLVKMRAHYTPQQLHAINNLFGEGGEGAVGENWVEMAMKVSKTTIEEITIGTRRRQESEMATIEIKPNDEE